MKSNVFLLMLGFVIPLFLSGKNFPDNKLWKQVKEIQKRILIIDGHTHEVIRKEPSRKWPRQISLDLMKKGGVNGALQGLPFTPSKSKNPSQKILEDIRYIKEEIQKYSGELELALTSADFVRIQKKGKRSLMLFLEYFYGILDGNAELLDTYYREGVRSITLFNGGKDQIVKKSVAEAPTESLSHFGKKVISSLNRLGMIIDITHLSEGMKYEVIETSVAPVMASHSNARGIVPHPMNLPDRMIKKMTEKGGIIMLSFHSPYVSKESFAKRKKIRELKKIPPARIDELIDHIDYIAKLVGIDYVGIGSDYGGSGRSAPLGLETAEGFPLIIFHMLKRGYGEKDIEKVMGGNFLRMVRMVENRAEK